MAEEALKDDALPADPASPPPVVADAPAVDPAKDKPDAAKAPDKSKTVLDADPEKGDPAPAADWPEDWREKLAGGDDKFLGILKRYASPQNFAKAYQSLRQKQDSGELKRARPEGEDEKALAEWRQENGIPDGPEGYEMPDGLVVGGDDKPLVSGFLAAAHKADMTPGQVKSALAWYYASQDDRQAARAEQDASVTAETEDALRAEYGSEYRGNLNAVKNLLSGAPGEAGDMLASARLPDGTPVFSHPDAVRWFVQLAREANPTATVVPGSGLKAAQAIDDEIAAIEKQMREDRKGYYADEKAQARYRQLLTARERSGQRAA